MCLIKNLCSHKKELYLEEKSKKVQNHNRMFLSFSGRMSFPDAASWVSCLFGSSKHQKDSETCFLLRMIDCDTSAALINSGYLHRLHWTDSQLLKIWTDSPVQCKDEKSTHTATGEAVILCNEQYLEQSVISINKHWANIAAVFSGGLVSGERSNESLPLSFDWPHHICSKAQQNRI